MKRAIVVGGSTGIGAATAARLRLEGWDVTVMSRSRPSADFRFIACDVTDEASVKAAFDEAVGPDGAPDAIVYAAGTPVMGRTTSVPEDDARRAFEVHFWGVTRVVQRVFPGMAKRGSGAIVVVLSIAAMRAVPFESYYAASKAACARWLECFAFEASAVGVDVRYVAPGLVPTGFIERGGWHAMQPPAIQGSNISADDVASAIVKTLDGRRSSAVIGWRERAITLADRALPGAYDALLRRRLRRSGG